jgi:hypothetical protein
MPRPDFTNDRLGILHGITLDDTTDKHAAPTECPNPVRESSHRRRQPSNSPEAPAEARADDQKSSERPRTKKFRFKKKRRDTSSSRHGDEHSRHADEGSNSSKRRRRDEYRAPLDDDPSQYDDSYIPNAAAWSRAADPDAAFRESLFDAMADDEGAAFWEGVYGQPIHVYERPGVTDERGELERMTDEEYARYVREKMWEKSHQYIMEERERREKRRERQKQEEKEEQREWECRERERKIKEMSRREQRAKDKMRMRWDQYAQYWETSGKGLGDPGNIRWPVVSGKTNDVTREAVEEFILAHPSHRTLPDVLKAERIRWHPDKAQQRWGREALTELEMKAVTTVFQTVDALWQARGEKAS